MQSKASTVEQYLSELPAERREAIATIRAVILRNIDPLVREGMQYGMIGYAIPHSIYPSGYHCDPRQPLPFAGLASQKQHMSLYVMMTYGQSNEEGWLRDRWAATGKRLDMGKCCIRFRRLEDVPLDVVAEIFQRVRAREYIASYERTLADLDSARAARKAAKSKAPAKPGAKKPATKKTAKKATKKTSKKTGARAKMSKKTAKRARAAR